MVRPMQRTQARLCHMGIDLCCAEIRVSQQQLYRPQVGAMVDQMRGECMTKAVRRDRHRDAGATRMPLDAVPERLPGQRRACGTGKQMARHALPGSGAGAQPLEIAAKPFERVFADRHQAFLVALADDPHQPLLRRELIATQRHEFAHPQPGRVQQLEHCAITQPEVCRRIRRREQPELIDQLQS